ncbi:Hypothetical predicted protein [Scomber scombrus]|uniref:Uncharacterized protein n=1 Tax=Scomber scombrus TaxID=13677 RepID=A0AAV1Q698_SCOSC
MKIIKILCSSQQNGFRYRAGNEKPIDRLTKDSGFTAADKYLFMNSWQVQHVKHRPDQLLQISVKVDPNMSLNRRNWYKFGLKLSENCVRSDDGSSQEVLEDHSAFAVIQLHIQQKGEKTEDGSRRSSNSLLFITGFQTESTSSARLMENQIQKKQTLDWNRNKHIIKSAMSHCRCHYETRFDANIFH